MTPELRELLDAARRAAREAAIEILEIYRTPFEVRQKSDASPVTAADELAEKIITAALLHAAPDIPVIAEEMAERSAPQPSARYWLVDPLDGTKEFVAKSGEFSTNIGLIADGRPVLGVIHLPHANVTYAAAGAGTATRQQGDGPAIPIETRAVPAAAPIVIRSRSHGNNERLAAYLSSLSSAQIRVAGSAAKFCFIAEGSADLYPRFGTTMEWDTAAGQAILEAAGGSVVTFDGAPLRYGKPGFRNSEFLARGRT
jgi:3'(2'), 5'-bisphosphate nucleotidase